MAFWTELDLDALASICQAEHLITGYTICGDTARIELRHTSFLLARSRARTFLEGVIRVQASARDESPDDYRQHLLARGVLRRTEP